MTTHDPVMPLWHCSGCQRPWPCPVRRRELRAEYDQASLSLALYLASHLMAATQDMAWASPTTLHRRFLGWLR